QALTQYASQGSEKACIASAPVSVGVRFWSWLASVLATSAIHAFTLTVADFAESHGVVGILGPACGGPLGPIPVGWMWPANIWRKALPRSAKSLAPPPRSTDGESNTTFGEVTRVSCATGSTSIFSPLQPLRSILPVLSKVKVETPPGPFQVIDTSGDFFESSNKM